MCGRYVISYTLDELRQLFEFEDRPNLEPNYNVAPSLNLPLLRRGAGGQLRLTPVRWGLVPHWSKRGPGSQDPINARSETAAQKPSFRQALARRRALVPASGFYEWQREGETKTPYFITLSDARPMVFAGLWERWGEGEAQIDSFAILTAPANEDIAPIHHRTPVLIDPDAAHAWLDPDTDPAPFLTAPPKGTFGLREVSKTVNSVRNGGPGLIEPVDRSPGEPD